MSGGLVWMGRADCVEWMGAEVGFSLVLSTPIALARSHRFPLSSLQLHPPTHIPPPLLLGGIGWMGGAGGVQWVDK